MPAKGLFKVTFSVVRFLSVRVLAVVLSFGSGVLAAVGFRDEASRTNKDI